MTDRAKPTAETRAAEREEMDARHEPDRDPTPDEETAAERGAPSEGRRPDLTGGNGAHAESVSRP